MLSYSSRFFSLLDLHKGWLASLCFFVSSAQAADTLPAVPFAPLAFASTPGLSTEELNLRVQGREALFRLDVKNTSNLSLHKKISFSLQSFTWEGLSDDYFDKNFPELTVQVGSRQIHPLVTTQAFLKKKDVTFLLKHAGFDPLMVASANPDQFPADDTPSSRRAQRLVAAGLFAERQGTYFPSWHTAVRYHWVQRFPKNSNVEITYKYRLRPGFGIVRINDDALNNVLRANCGSIDEVQSLLKEVKPSPEFFLFEEFDIPLASPSPRKVKIEFNPQRLNESFVPIASFGCLDKKTYQGSSGTAGFSALASNIRSVRFVAISYQKIEPN